ncbi:MAG: hypothetical protein ROR55_18085 [Devosia sp.]
MTEPVGHDVFAIAALSDLALIEDSTQNDGLIGLLDGLDVAHHSFAGKTMLAPDEKTVRLSNFDTTTRTENDFNLLQARLGGAYERVRSHP